MASINTLDEDKKDLWLHSIKDILRASKENCSQNNQKHIYGQVNLHTLSSPIFTATYLSY